MSFLAVSSAVLLIVHYLFDSMHQAEHKKKLGNKEFEAKNFKEAVALYGEAIDMAGDEVPATYFSNRAVAWAALDEWQHARDDAEKAMQRPNGTTAKMLFQKIRAELKLEEINAAEQTMALATRCGLREEVDELLKAKSLSLPALAKSSAASPPRLEEAQHEVSKSVFQTNASMSRDISYLKAMGAL